MNPSLPPVFVISLKGSHARRAAMAAQMERCGLPFEFFDAVDGRSLDVTAQPRYDGMRRLAFFGKHLTGGEWGCLLSHFALYEKMIAADIPRCVIFEDDALLAPEFRQILETILSTDFQYDLVRFMGSTKIARKGYRKILKVGGDLWLGRLPSIHGGAHAYLITQQGARKMLAYAARHKIAYPVDTLLGRCWETGLDVYAVNPVVRQDTVSFTSDIGEARFDKRADLSPLGRVLFPLTRGWYKLAEHAGKRWVYAAAARRDTMLRERHGV